MLNNAKALVVVLALALLTFHVCRPIAVQFMREETFARRRNIWLALTVVAFLSPSFWLWVLTAIVILVPAGRKDANPISLFCLLMFVAPGVNISIPVVGINQLFPLSPLRLLAMIVLVPAYLRMRQQAAHRQSTRWADLAMIGFVVLQIALLVPYETVTTTMRRSLLLLLDVLLVYFAFSRLSDRAALLDAIASLWLSNVLMAPVAIFESLRGWLLYPGVAATWGDPNIFSYLLRGDELRAQAAANHSIGLGYQAAMGLGLYLLLRTLAPRDRWRDILVIVALGAATVVSYARGGWVTALIFVLLFALLRPEAKRHLPNFVAGAVAVCIAAFFSPLRDKVLQRLPFVGTTDQDTIGYRQQLSDLGWSLVMQSPFFGDPFATDKMAVLRQGQGIIDIVNGYLFVALFNGLVGLGLLVSVFAFAIWTVWKTYRRPVDRTAMAIGAGFLSAFLATLAFIATAGIGTFTYVLCGLLISYAAMQKPQSWSQRIAPSQATPPNHPRPA